MKQTNLEGGKPLKFRNNDNRIRLPVGPEKRKGDPRIRGSAINPCNLCLKHKAGVIDIQTEYDEKGRIFRRVRRYFCCNCKGRFTLYEISEERLRDMVDIVTQLNLMFNGFRRSGLLT